MDVKACPFCNGNDVWVIRELGPKTYVQCQECGARSNTYYGERHESNAIAAWNQRAPAEAAEQRVREVEALPAKWRNNAWRLSGSSAWNSPNGAGDGARKSALQDCADELDRAMKGTGSGSADNG